jgi:hypothetical protein
MLYEVNDSNGGRFEHRQDDPLKVGGYITLPEISYRVLSIGPGEGRFTGVVTVERAAGPARFTGG